MKFLLKSGELIVCTTIACVVGSYLVYMVAGKAIERAAVVTIWALVGIAIATGLIWVVAFALRLYSRHQLEIKSLQLQQLDYEREQMRKANEQLMMFSQLYQMNSGLIYASSLAGTNFNALPKPQVTQQLPAPAVLVDPLKPLLPAIVNLQRILIVGGQGSGKTTLMQWIAHERLKKGSVLLLDSHDFPAKWPQGCQIVGNGRQYQLIARAMQALVDKMGDRYKEYSAGVVGEREHELITTMADEWTLLPEYIDDIGQFLGPILTESRKVAIDLILGTHSETARSLGLKGRYDLKGNFDVIVRLQNISGQRFAVADFGDGGQRYELPGPFNQPQPASQPPDSILTLDLAPEPAPVNDQVERIRQLNAEGKSMNEIAQILFGKPAAGNIYYQIKEALQGF